MRTLRKTRPVPPTRRRLAPIPTEPPARPPRGSQDRPLIGRSRPAPNRPIAPRHPDLDSRPSGDLMILERLSRKMRGPINAILGTAEDVLSTRLPRGHEAQLSLIKNAAEALLGILNEQVDFARARTGELRFEEIAFSLIESVAVAVRQVTPEAHRKGLPIHVHISPSAPPLLSGDPYRLRQILVKLLSNAVRFTSHGEVHLRIEETASEPDHTTLRFAIEDCGKGMDADQIRKILLAGDQSVFDPHAGVVRGLVACQIMIARLGGQLEIISRPGEGTTFLFDARFIRARSAPSQIQGGQLENLPVLVVSGHLQRRSQLAAVLADWNMQPETATSADKAISHLEAARRRSAPFQAIIIDEQLGESSGFSFAEQLQQRPELAPPVRILAVTAGQRGDADRCRQLGIQAYLSNPIQALDILDALMLSLGAPAAERPLITRHSLRERRRTLQVLVVGGAPVHQVQTVVLLEKLGHSPTAVRDVSEAREACAGAHFDAILLDLDEVGVPGAGDDARQALDLRLPSHQAAPPLIGLHTSGNPMPNGADWAGLTLLLSKPIRPAELAAGLTSLEYRPVGDPPPHPASDTPLDLEKLRWSLGDDDEMLRELLATYLSDAARVREDLAAARSSGDLRTYREKLQALRGMISSLMAGPAVLALRRLEAACDSGATTDIPEAADHLDRELDRLNAALSQIQDAPGTPAAANDQPRWINSTL